MKKISLSLLTVFLSCSPPSYEYDASNVISYLRDYKNGVDIPELTIHSDSTFSIRENCFILMNDKRIHIDNSSTTIPLSKREVKELFKEIWQQYNEEIGKNPPETKKRNYNAKKHFYRKVYLG